MHIRSHGAAGMAIDSCLQRLTNKDRLILVQGWKFGYKYIYIYLWRLNFLISLLQLLYSGLCWVPCPSPFPHPTLPISSSCHHSPWWGCETGGSRIQNDIGEKGTKQLCVYVHVCVYKGEIEKDFACVSVFMKDKKKVRCQANTTIANKALI